MDSDDRFEQLQAKFRPAIEFLEHPGISIQSLNIQDNRLLVRVVAPSAEVRDEILDQFRRLDPSLDQVHPDIRIDGLENVPQSGQSSVHGGQSFSQPGETTPNGRG